MYEVLLLHGRQTVLKKDCLLLIECKYVPVTHPRQLIRSLKRKLQLVQLSGHLEH